MGEEKYTNHEDPAQLRLEGEAVLAAAAVSASLQYAIYTCLKNAALFIHVKIVVIRINKAAICMQDIISLQPSSNSQGNTSRTLIFHAIDHSRPVKISSKVEQVTSNRKRSKASSLDLNVRE